MKALFRFPVFAFFIAIALLPQITTAADYWTYPLSRWPVSRDFGVPVNNWDGKGSNGWHLGQDVWDKDVKALTIVKNARWGYVRYAGPASGYGNVVIIESPRDFEASTNPSTWKNPYCQVYGHLRNDSYLEATRVKKGQIIDRGTVIGRLGYQSENGGFVPHLHYGIRKGRYSSTWVYWGYTTGYSQSAQTVLNQWLKPSGVIDKY